jgi:putative drug exporter of the RND superfamily
VGEVRRRQYERRVLHPGAQSQKAEDLLEERFPAQAGGTASVVFHAKSGTLTDPANQAAIEQTQANLAPGTAPHVTAGSRADDAGRRPGVRVEERHDRLRTSAVRRRG